MSEKPESKPFVITKAWLAERHGFSASHLAKLLNVDYFEELQKVGYKKRSIILSPVVFEAFEASYGPPKQKKDLL